MRTLLLLILLSFSASAQESAAADQPLTRILFGSCIKQDRPAPIFETILERKPEAFLFIGDNIYGDTEDMAVMKAKYETLAAIPGFAELRTTCPLYATWDDHDYGADNAGSEYPMRAESAKVFLDFWNTPADSPRRRREGIYDGVLLGPEGKRLQILLLDTRYHRGPLTTGERRTGGTNYPAKDSAITMLGEAQWAWLESELRKPAEIRIIASGIQIIAEAAGQETWSNLPHERQRLVNLIESTNARGVLFISGDRHWADLSLLGKKDGAPYPLYDLTSSGLNQIHARGTPTDNRFRAIKKTYHRENFGEIEIDWDASPVRIHLSVRDLQGDPQIKTTLFLDQLTSK